MLLFFKPLYRPIHGYIEIKPKEKKKGRKKKKIENIKLPSADLTEVVNAARVSRRRRQEEEESSFLFALMDGQI